MKLYKNGYQVDTYTESYSGQHIVIAIDSSKSNSGIIVGNTNGNILDDYEIDGSGSDVDVFDLCRDTRLVLTQLFKNAKIEDVGIEDIITKKEGQYKGLDIHMSRAKITTVWNNFIFFFEMNHNIRPRFINNQEWKSHTLPEEYRKRSHHKGSKDYLSTIEPRWENRSDDVTDAVCIYRYMMMTKSHMIEDEIYSIEACNAKRSVCLVPVNYKLSDIVKRYRLATDCNDINKNIDTVLARLSTGDYGTFVVNIKDVPIEWFYNGSLATDGITYPLGVKELRVLVRRD